MRARIFPCLISLAFFGVKAAGEEPGPFQRPDWLPPVRSASEAGVDVGGEPGCCCTDWNCCPYPPGRAWISAEYLLWWTRGNPLPPLLTTSPPGTPFASAGVLGQPGTSVLFGGQDVADGVRSGGRFTTGYWFTPEHTLGIEGSFFFLQNLVTDYSASSNGIPILARPFLNLAPGPAFGANGSLKIAYPGVVAGSFFASTKSNLLGSDVYFRCPICCDCCWRLDLLAGYRYLRLSEGLQISETEISTNPANALFGLPFLLNDSFNTSNNFNGGEIGFIGECMRNSWFLRLTAKVGLGATERNVNINGTTQFDGGPVAGGGFLALPSNIGSYHSSTFSVVPEIGINLGYAITPNLRVFTGYSFLYWTRWRGPAIK